MSEENFNGADKERLMEEDSINLARIVISFFEKMKEDEIPLEGPVNCKIAIPHQVELVEDFQTIANKAVSLLNQSGYKVVSNFEDSKDFYAVNFLCEDRF